MLGNNVVTAYDVFLILLPTLDAFRGYQCEL